MKKILVIGGSGTIGINVIKYLLLEGKYEITALDLKNKDSINTLKKYRKRINILHGDTTDRILIESLVKDQDYIIYLASCIPPLSDMKKGLSDEIDLGGCENVIRALSYYNPKCHLFYASSTSVYKNSIPNVKSKISLGEFDYFEVSKIECEKLIKNKLKNYTIYRIPLVLTDNFGKFIYTGCKKELMDVITSEDAAMAFVRGIKYSDKVNKKIFNLKTDTVMYKDILNNILKYYGLSFRYVLSRSFLEKSYSSKECSDSNELNELINYNIVTVKDYYKKIDMKYKNRKVQRVLAKPFVKKEGK